MAKTELAVVILAAGQGTRMKSDLPKVLHKLAGRPMITHLVENVAALGPARVALIVAPGMAAVGEAAGPGVTAIEASPMGTGDSARAARALLDGFTGTVLVLCGDAPLITGQTLKALIEAKTPEKAVVVLAFRPDDPGPYGRLVVGEDGGLDAIVEALDATQEQLEIGLCNSGAIAADGAVLFDLLDAVGKDNAKGEYYLTDIIAIARARGLACLHVEAPAEEVLGINSRADLAAAEAVLQRRLRAAAMADGVTLSDPETVYFSFDTRLGRDVTVAPHVVFGPGVSVGAGAAIHAYCHIEGAEIAAGASVGPFARLRPGTRIGEGARVGNFVEVKNAVLGDGAKANHLSYLGDASIGPAANIGAGTITCNYDGIVKSRTNIGAGAFIGSNTALVAPVTVGKGAIVGAGSVVTRDVADDAIAVTRAEQRESAGGATRYRQRKAKAKAKKEPAKGN